MRNLWLIARQEYAQRVGQRSFLLATLSIPLLLAVVTAVGVLTATGSRDTRPLGYVDRSGLISAQAAPAADAGDGVAVLPFADEAAARAAVEAGQIQAYYLLPEDYAFRREVIVYYGKEPPGQRARSAFDAFLRRTLVAGRPEAVAQRLLAGSELTLSTLDGRRQLSESGFMDALLPFVAGLLFVIATLSSSGYLMQALTAEKENRTVEVMMTAVRPLDLVAGKAAGLMAVSLTQLAIWLAVAVAAVLVARPSVPELAELRVSPQLVLLILVYFLPSYALIAGMMTTIGAIMPDLQQGQQLAGTLNLLFMMPYLLAALLFANPNSPVAVALTLFPTTAFTTLIVRWGLTAVPLWQIATGWALLVLSALAMLWVASRVFRIGMLAYGQRLSLAGIRAALRRE